MSGVRLGTRGSALAVAQARLVATALDAVQVELVTITTSGDRASAGGRAAGGVGEQDKSRWVSELESALLAGEVDAAVHSAKDVPGELAAGLSIVAVPAREDARDALVGAASLDALRPGARVGTSSLRRRAQLSAARDDLEIVELRGNVDTRLRRLDAGELDAIVLAAAGLRRLGLADRIDATLDPGVFVPAPGQGTLAVEARADDEATNVRLAGLTAPRAVASLEAERALCAELGASCNTPVGAHATLEDATLRLTAFAGLPDGSAWLRDELEGPADEPAALGRQVALRLRTAGADELLREAEAAVVTGP